MRSDPSPVKPSQTLIATQGSIILCPWLGIATLLLASFRSLSGRTIPVL